MMNEIQCPACGASVAANAAFCPRCGTRTDAPPAPRKCPSCSSELAPDVKFCPTCGANTAPEAPSAEPNPAPKQPKPKKEYDKDVIRSFVKKSVVLAVALLLFIFAFLPVFSYEFEDSAYIDGDYEEFDVTLGFSAMDAIAMNFDAMQSLDYDDLEDSSLAEKIEELAEEAEDAEKESEYIPIAKKATKLTMRLMLRYESSPYRILYLVAALLALVYFLAATALLVFSAMDFVCFLLDKHDGPFAIFEKLGTFVPLLLTAIPSVAIATSIATHVSYYGFSTGTTAKTPATLVLSVIFALIAILTPVVMNLFFSDKKFSFKDPSINWISIAKKTVSCIAAFVLMVSVLLPVMSMKAETNFGYDDDTSKASVGINLLYFKELTLTEDESEGYEELSDDEDSAITAMEYQFSGLSSYKKKAFAKGESMSTNYSLLNIATLGFGLYSVSFLFAAVPLLLLLAVIAAGVILWQNLYSLTEKKPDMQIVTTSARFVMIGAVALALILTLIFAIIASANFGEIDFDKDCDLSVSIGAAPFFLLILAAIPLVLPMIDFDKLLKKPSAAAVPEAASAEPAQTEQYTDTTAEAAAEAETEAVTVPAESNTEETAPAEDAATDQKDPNEQ